MCILAAQCFFTSVKQTTTMEGSVKKHRFLKIFICLLTTLSFTVDECGGVLSESEILLNFRKSLEDPSQALQDWKSSIDVCRWSGITCNGKNTVTRIRLDSTNIGGNLSATVCDLPDLEVLSLSNNNINFTIPEDIGRCRSLKTLNLSINYIYGRIPASITNISSLQILDLNSLSLKGPIPSSISNLSNLSYLDLSYNFISGPVPEEIGALKFLTFLDLSQNNFGGSGIPSSLGNLANLQSLFLYQSGFAGTIPATLGDLRSLKILQLSENNLEGGIPQTLTRLKNLEYFQLYNNRLSGKLPSGLSNLTQVVQLDLANNSLSGVIPSLQGLTKLQNLHLYMNKLEGPLPIGTESLPALLHVMLFKNNLNGTLPPSLGIHGRFISFEVSENNFQGVIPPTLCKGNLLQNLSLHTNNFHGPIPASYNLCKSFWRLHLQNNRFSGQFPKGIWTSPNLTIVNIENNSFTGSIPAQIFQAAQLSQVQIDRNRFSGQFPEELGKMPSLYKLTASGNRFSGSFPESICNCPSLSIINVSHNSLSGHLPSFGGCKKLVSLSFASNNLEGGIPVALGTLPVLTYIDLSANNFNGPIPAQFGDLKLVLFNVSFNRLSGRVPISLISSLPSSNLEGNSGLCGEGMARSCTQQENTDQSHKNQHLLLIWILIAAFAGGGIVLALGILLIQRSWRNDGYYSSKSKWNTVPFIHLGFDEDEVLAKLEDGSLVGSGASGKVYRVSLPSGETVAVKRLWKAAKIEGNNKHAASIRTEIETLGKVRHRNIVKLLSCCCSDHATFLVYEYLPQGSLANVLYNSEIVLQWHHRFKIAVGTARGLAYLHHDFVPQVLHRDIKSHNVLLDYEYEPKIADFGLAKILGDNSTHLHSMTSVVGSYGYIAPEYAYNAKVNEKTDVYSYGVVLLELITGRRAVEVEAGELIDIVKWVRGKVNTKDGVPRVLDPKIKENSEEDMISALKVALLCTSVLPQRRPTMREVVEMLQLLDPAASPQPLLLPLFDYSSESSPKS